MKQYGLFIVLGIVLLPRLGQAQEAALPVLSEQTLPQEVGPWN